jgi:hypothetical protein
MHRGTIVAPERLLDRLRLITAERATSLASSIGHALEHRIGRRPPRPRSLGVGASGHMDTSARTAAERPIPRYSR